MTEYERQLLQVTRNTNRIIDTAKATLRSEFADIDRAHTRTGVNGSGAQRPNKIILAPDTIHDKAANDPRLRAMLRMLDRAQI